MANARSLQFGGMCWCTHHFLGATQARVGATEAVGSATTEPQDNWRQPVSHPPPLLRSVSALSPPRPVLPFSLLLSPPLFPHSPLPRLPVSVARAPFPCTSTAAGSQLASPPPPLLRQNHRIRWCFSAASASAAGRPLAALPAALRPSLR